jgi:uncharacterized membrane protein YoaK (UPF0700 family)
MLLLLTWAAGIVDAVAYLGLGVFTAMMTGNTALLAFAVARGQLTPVLRSGLALMAFSAGAATGAVIAGRGRFRSEWPSGITAALAVEGILLGVFSLLWALAGPTRDIATTGLLIVVSGLAMGVQSAAVRYLGIPGVATTYVTATVTNLGAELVAWGRPTSTARPPADASGPATRGERIRLLTAVFITYGLGALVGGVLQARSSALAIWLPLICVTVVVINGFLRMLPSGRAVLATAGS